MATEKLNLTMQFDITFDSTGFSATKTKRIKAQIKRYIKEISSDEFSFIGFDDEALEDSSTRKVKMKFI